jgi:hypothetical protein
MPRMIDLIRASAVPSTLMQSAAKGALSVPPGEMVEILVYLSTHKLFGEQARLTLAGWDPRLSLAAASDPQTAREVLEYMAAPQNLRPALISALLENPSIPEHSLVELVESLSRDAVDLVLASSRGSGSEKILRALSSNPNLSGIQSAAVDDRLVSLRPSASTAAAEIRDEILLDTTISEGIGPEEVLDENLAAYLTQHADEIAAEGEKPFQPIGGFYEDFVPSTEEPLSEPPPTKAVAAAAPADHKAPAAKKAHTGLEQERGSALQKISRLDIKGRIQLAMKGTKEERSLLIRDGTKIVALAVLDSPKISDAEVEKFASQKNVLEAVLRAIPMKRRFMKHYGIVRSLVFNPRTPLDVGLGLMKNILVHDLRNLSGNKEVSETVRKLALKMFKQKMDTSKKSTD